MKTEAVAKPVNLVTFLAWGDQDRTESLAWHLAKRPGTTKAEQEAYRAGHEQAWIKALATLKLHGMVVSDGK